MATRLNIFFLLAMIVLSISSPTFAVLIKSEDIDTLEKLEATARKYFSRGDPAQLEQSDIARRNYLETLETLLAQAAQLTGLIPDTYMRLKQEFVKKEIFATRETIGRLVRDREHFTSRLLQTMGVSEVATLKQRLTLAEYDEDVETHMAYLELLDTRLKRLWTDGDVKPLGHVLPNGLITHGFVTFGYRYFIEDTRNLMFTVHPHKLRIAESLYGLFYDAFVALHAVHLKLSIPFPKAKNASLQSRFDLFNPRDRETSLKELGFEFIRDNMLYFKEKVAPMTQSIAALRAEIARLQPLSVQETLPTHALDLSSWVMVGDEGESPLPPQDSVQGVDATHASAPRNPSVDLTRLALFSPPFSPQPGSSTQATRERPDTLRPEEAFSSPLSVQAPPLASIAGAAISDHSGAESAHSFFDEDWEGFNFDQLSNDSGEQLASAPLGAPTDLRAPDDGRVDPSRNTSPVTIASSLNPDEDNQWQVVESPAEDGPSSAEPVSSSHVAPLLLLANILGADSVDGDEWEHLNHRGTPPTGDLEDFELVYDDVEPQPHQSRPEALILDAAPAPEQEDVQEDATSGDDDTSSLNDDDLQQLLSRMQHHSQLRTTLEEHQNKLRELEASQRNFAKAIVLAKARASSSESSLLALKAKPSHLSRMTERFMSTLRNLSTNVRSAATRAKETIQRHMHRAALPKASITKAPRNVTPSPQVSGPLLEENLEAPVSAAHIPSQLEELIAGYLFQIKLVQESVPSLILGNYQAPLPYSPTPFQLPPALQEITVLPLGVSAPAYYRDLRVSSPETLRAPTPSRMFNLSDLLIPVSLITSGASQDTLTNAVYSTQSMQTQPSYGLSSSTTRSSPDTSHVGGMTGATAATTALTGGSSIGASFHESHHKASSYSAHQNTTHIQKLHKASHYPTMRMPLPHRGNRRLFDSLVAVAA